MLDSYKLTGNLCFYSRKESYSTKETPTCYAEFHDVHYVDDTPVLGAGRSLSVSQIKQITQTAYHDFKKELSKVKSTGFLPENILAYRFQTANPTVCFWTEPRIYPLAHNDDKKTYTVPYPALLFIVGKTFKVFSLKGRKRPTLESELHQAPFWNIGNFNKGDMCTGSCKKPSGNTAEEFMTSATNLFFNSYFSHDRGTKYGKHALDKFWQKLDGRKSFPTRSLIPTGKNLKEELKKSGLI